MLHTPGPWSMEPYGANWNHETQQWEHDGSRWTIVEPHIDVHPIHDGSGRKDEYPDGIIIGKEEAAGNAKLVRASPDLLKACEALPDFDLENPDAADFKDNAYQFITAMRLARAAIERMNQDG